MKGNDYYYDLLKEMSYRFSKEANREFRNFENYTLLVSGTFLTISITLINSIVALHGAILLNFLFFSWLSSLLTVLSVLASILIPGEVQADLSRKIFQKINLKSDIEDKEALKLLLTIEKRHKIVNSVTFLFRMVTCIFLLSSFIAFAFFVYCNLTR